jgi:cytochrome b561
VRVALKHHFVDKDEILKGMLPVSKREIASD